MWAVSFVSCRCNTLHSHRHWTDFMKWHAKNRHEVSNHFQTFEQLECVWRLICEKFPTKWLPVQFFIIHFFCCCCWSWSTNMFESVRINWIYNNNNNTHHFRRTRKRNENDLKWKKKNNITHSYTQTYSIERDNTILWHLRNPCKHATSSLFSDWVVWMCRIDIESKKNPFDRNKRADKSSDQQFSIGWGCKVE